MIEIPLSAIPAQTLRVILDGQDCTLSLVQRGRFLFADVSVADAVICVGAICRDGASIVQSPSLAFSGTLHFYDTLGVDDPQYSGLGTRWKLCFVPAGETAPASFI